MIRLPRRSKALVVLGLGLAVVAVAGTRRRATPAPAPSATAEVTAVRFWSLGDVTRVAIEANGDFQYDADRVSHPERIFFDLRGAVPEIGDHGLSTIPVNDQLVHSIRVAETRRDVTRVVLDLNGAADFTTSRLTNPDRLIIEVRRTGTTPSAKLSNLPGAPSGGLTAAAPPPAPAPAPAPRFTPPPQHRVMIAAAPILEPPSSLEPVNQEQPRHSPALVAKLAPKNITVPYQWPAPRANAAAPARNNIQAALPASARIKSDLPQRSLMPEMASPSTRESTGDRSMIRALDLKIGTIVLDAGHGGQDTGTIGPTGLEEKELVLDVTQRLGRLITQRLGANVVYTRNDDTFIPLKERTRIANEAHADLFLSIHANSSPLRAASGVETYYLNFTTSKQALEVAARENAGSEMNIGDLQDVIQKIALHDKVDESREFATHIQNALYATSRRLDSHSRDRGVRKAPFVVLIGASMPSVLAEIGFVSNLQDERLLRREEQRERIAEALYRGLAQYAGGLSHTAPDRRHTAPDRGTVLRRSS